MQVRTRFAPSPTGFLHIGGARTALFCWLYARRFGGKFVLRIEDTDVERSNAESVQTILQGMAWLDLDWDEGPFYQMQRMDRYNEIIQKLLDEGKAYRCYCSKDRLTDLREKQMQHKEKPRYDGLCREREKNISDQPYVIRFKNSGEGTVVFDDAVQGRIEIQNSELDDLIIARTDGTPTYNLTVVVDDMDMKITHVIRGADHINNTPRQINLLKALGYTPPIYAHVPMILDAGGAKLSKRHGAASVMEYRHEGYLPEAVLNYLARLGWSHGDQEIFSRQEMIDLFDINDVNRSPAALNADKLNWLNQYYMKTGDVKKTARELKYQLDKLNIDATQGPDLEDVIKIQAERCHTLVEMAEKSRYFYLDVDEYDPKVQKHLSQEIVQPLTHAKVELQKLCDWHQEKIRQIIIDTAEKFAIKLGKVAQPIRVAVTGGVVSPPIDATLFLIGQQRVSDRLEKALVRIAQSG